MRPALSGVFVRPQAPRGRRRRLVFIMQGDESGDKVHPDGSVGLDVECAEDSDIDHDARPSEE